jgi:hypothetical protein
MQKHTYTTKVGDRDVIVETGTLAKLAGGPPAAPSRARA